MFSEKPRVNISDDQDAMEFHAPLTVQLTMQN